MSGLKKASNVLYIIGQSFTILWIVTFIVFTVVSFIIAGPGYTDSIIEQLKEGKIHTSFVGTVEEQAAQIQRMFIPFAIVLLVYTLITITKFVFTLLAKRSNVKIFYITSIVLSALEADVFLILASSFGLAANKEVEEEINVSL